MDIQVKCSFKNPKWAGKIGKLVEDHDDGWFTLIIDRVELLFWQDELIIEQ